jgi:hypothetical protein
VSGSLADYLRKAASKVSERVDKTLMPKWLTQRNVDLKLLKEAA